ncbi:uncharacterized protein LOC128744510 [Sabethes cyaneus]|uniref:uncharacterized protein LOC128744510 n=1 Tax=Sabethes cyaneus TaxID=53552 RepID=UPI00237DD627|nr:uncharacterized protein LOC128744510 [Sabethes cyaneus]
MISLIGVAKIVLLCFVILFLKVKLCISFVPTRRSIGDSAQGGGDESPRAALAGKSAALQLNTSMIISSFMNYSANNNLHQHAFAPSAAHHVRHQKHRHVKNQPASTSKEVRALRALNRNDHSEVANNRLNVHHHHHHHHHPSIHNYRRVSHDAGSKTHRHPSNGNGRLHNLGTGNPSSLAATPDELKTVRPEHGNLSHVNKRPNINNRTASQLRRSHSYSYTTVSPAPAVQPPHRLRTNQNAIATNRKRTTSAHSKRYFQALLNSYRQNSPYNKKQNRIDSNLMTKSLGRANGSNKCWGTNCSRAGVQQQHRHHIDEDEYDYDDDGDEEDDYDEDDDEDEEQEQEQDEAEDDGDGHDGDNSVGDGEVDDRKNSNGDNDARKHVETQGDAGYGMTIVNGSAFKHSHRPTVRGKKGSGELKQDHQDISSALAFTQSRPSFVQTTTEGRKILKHSHRMDISRLASHHASKIRQEGSCSVPQPKMVPASNDPTKQYTPHCTILHRCGDDVGCCLPTQTCASSKNTTIELYFFVQAVGSRSSIERLSFINHTECACINRHESSVAVHPVAIAGLSSGTVPVPVSVAAAAPNCTCPALFQRMIDNDNRCRCDCSSSHPQCDRFKHGLEHFSMENRRCIKDGRCHEPVCEYGHYNKAKGKCPTREDKLSYSYKG